MTYLPSSRGLSSTALPPDAQSSASSFIQAFSTKLVCTDHMPGGVPGVKAGGEEQREARGEQGMKTFGEQDQHEGLKNEAYGPPSHSFPESRVKKAGCFLAMPSTTSVIGFKLPLERM